MTVAYDGEIEATIDLATGITSIKSQDYKIRS